MSRVYTLLIRLEGPMQSWGYRSRFDYRDTAAEPTRSGVIGLICAAMGIARGEDIFRFDAIRMGVRVDREGKPENDYHTVLGLHSRSNIAVVSYRDYLADAIFTVGLESCDLDLLEEIRAALSDPKWPLFLGRKSFCLTEHPLSACRPAIIEMSLKTSLEAAAFSLRCTPPKSKDGKIEELRYRLVCEQTDGERTQHDWPICFGERRFKPRSMHVYFGGEGGRT